MLGARSGREISTRGLFFLISPSLTQRIFLFYSFLHPLTQPFSQSTCKTTFAFQPSTTKTLLQQNITTTPPPPHKRTATSATMSAALKTTTALSTLALFTVGGAAYTLQRQPQSSAATSTSSADFSPAALAAAEHGVPDAIRLPAVSVQSKLYVLCFPFCFCCQRPLTRG